MRTRLSEILAEATELINGSTVPETLETIKVKYLGKKGELTSILKQMGGLSAEDRPVIGQLANEVRQKIESLLDERSAQVSKGALESRLAKEGLDVTMPSVRRRIGTRHPIAQATEHLSEVFLGMGFDICEGPEIEYVSYNFDALNEKEGHPARELSDTFYINEKVLLRTQTSPVQIRTMEKQKPPIRMIAPGRVYRCDEVDATHSPMFHQLEGLVVDKGITMGDLKGTLEVFARNLFGEDARLRFRPHHFPFTEPSAEVDVSCFVCGGTGCRVCKGEGWIEMLGCGMVHPKVLEICGIDSTIYSGFAFGMGIDRIAMCKFGVDDMRLLFDNDIRFLEQF
ncbi:MAG: phenylalanine--tRNA ligase subunit alpha [Eubacteriales bacterium]